MKTQIINGDCLEVLRTLADNSLDSLVTDPPAGISFMGKAWDDDKGGRDHWIAWLTEVMRECYRVLKPGAHGVVWALPRTSHWTATALENAGFEIRDIISHLFGSGFPKSRRVNQDPRFCQCAELVRNAANTDRAQQPECHSDNEAGVSGDALLREDARHSTHTDANFLAGYLPDRDSSDEHVRQKLATAPEIFPSQECVPAHSRSAAHEDGQAGESSHSLSLALCSDRPSNQDFSPHAMTVSDAAVGTSANTRGLENTPTQKGIDSLASHTSHKILLPPACATPNALLNICQECGKPESNGIGTALKPASEHWVLIRKPLSEKTVAANVLKYGTGGINVDGCRISHSETLQRPPLSTNKHEGYQRPWNDDAKAREAMASRKSESADKAQQLGRFPANLVLSHNEDCADVCTEGCAAAMLDEQSGITKSTGGTKGGALGGNGKYGSFQNMERANAGGLGDSGGASRFFYCAKASKSDRNRKAKHVESREQTRDSQIDHPNELFDPAGNPARGHSA